MDAHTSGGSEVYRAMSSCPWFWDSRGPPCMCSDRVQLPCMFREPLSVAWLRTVGRRPSCMALCTPSPGCTHLPVVRGQHTGSTVSQSLVFRALPTRYFSRNLSSSFHTWTEATHLQGCLRGSVGGDVVPWGQRVCPRGRAGYTLGDFPWHQLWCQR